VFHACEHAGAPVETDEMAPQWFAFDSIPYHSMWADDPLWYPLVLRGGARFRGTFHFKDTHTLVWHELAEVAQLEEPP
jgi:8-oxo-dGTP diphosphatase